MGKMPERSLSVGIALNVVATFLLRSVSFITAPITTRLLAESEYGALSIFSTWTSIVTIVLGLRTYGTLTNARMKYDSDEEYYRYCWNSLLLSILAHLAVFVVVQPCVTAISGLFHLSPLLFRLMILQSFLNSGVNHLNAYFLIENAAQKNFILSAVNSVGAFIISYCLLTQTTWFAPYPYMGFIAGHSIALFLTGGFSFFWFFIKGSSLPNRDFTEYCLRLSLPIVFHSISGLILGQSDRVMLERMADLSATGVYSFTYNFSSIISTIWGSINSIWVPFYFRFLKAGDERELKRHMRNFDRLFLILVSGFLLLYPEVFHLVANKRYWTQMNLIPILVTAFYWGHLYGYPVNYEFYREKTAPLATGTACAAVLNILLNYMLIPRYQAAGAAVATMLSYMALYIFHTVIARRVLKGYPVSLAEDLFRLVPLIVVLFVWWLLGGFPILRWGIGIALGLSQCARIYRTRELL